jgi:hypothetical protein
VTIYSRLPALRRQLGLPEGVDDDARLLDLARQMSRQIDAMAGYPLYPEIRTIRVPRPVVSRGDPAVMFLPRPAQSIDYLGYGWASAEIELTEGTDWQFELPSVPHVGYRAVRLLPDARVQTWPRYWTRLHGIWGPSWGRADTGVTGSVGLSGDTVTVPAGTAGLIYPGDTIEMGSEWLEVTAASPTTLTVTRAVNGSTAAAHSAAPIRVLTPPEDLERALLSWLAVTAWNDSAGWQGSVVLTEHGVDAGGIRSTPPWRAVVAALAPYRQVALA